VDGLRRGGALSPPGGIWSAAPSENAVWDLRRRRMSGPSAELLARLTRRSSPTRADGDWPPRRRRTLGRLSRRPSAAPEVPARLSSCLASRVKPIDRPGDTCRVGDDVTRPSKPLAVLCRDAKKVFRGSGRRAVPFAIVRATSQLEPINHGAHPAEGYAARVIRRAGAKMGGPQTRDPFPRKGAPRIPAPLAACHLHAAAL
jgi:hypothetical protein